jgi:hypothetical protein
MLLIRSGLLDGDVPRAQEFDKVHLGLMVGGDRATVDLEQALAAQVADGATEDEVGDGAAIDQAVGVLLETGAHRSR